MDGIEAEYARRARTDLHLFTRLAWNYADQSSFVDSWAVGAICEHLEACARRQIRKLLINIPPRHSKSLLTSVFFPSWLWIEHPQERILSASYGITLSRRDSRLARQVIRSSWYQQHYGKSFKILHDQDEKAEYENNRGGKRIATSVGGMGTGAGGSFIIVDDPHKADEINSIVERQAVTDWWNQTMSTRIDDPETGVQIVIMQRLHEGDLSGEILRAGGWEHLRLPARYEAERPCVTSIGWRDPRTVNGELLSPERFTEAAIAELEKRLGSYAAAGQLQQRPAPAEGGRVKAAWWKYFRDAPTPEQIILSIDCGTKPKSHNDPTAIGVWLKSNNNHYRIDEFVRQMDYPTMKAKVISMCEYWKPNVVLIEDKGSGSDLIPELRNFTPDFNWPIIPQNPISDKATRLDAVTPMIEAGMVWLPEYAPWLSGYLDELTTFPNATHDDRVDETSQYLKYARGGRDFEEIMGDLRSMADDIPRGGRRDSYDVNDDRGSGYEFDGLADGDMSEMNNW